MLFTFSGHEIIHYIINRRSVINKKNTKVIGFFLITKWKVMETHGSVDIYHLCTKDFY